MKKDIILPPVEDIVLAVIREKNEKEGEEWNVYLLNLKKEAIESVLITSKGYGSYEGRDVKTSVLRHFFESIPALGFAKIELIVENLFGLNNEFWVSFYQNRIMYDKKYIFLAESIKEENFIQIPLIHKRGVMIR